MDRTTIALEEKNKIILEIEQRLNNWDGTVEDALLALEENEEKFIQLREIDQRISITDLQCNQKKMKAHWENILEKQNELLTDIQEGKKRLNTQFEQFSKKDKVVSNYIALQNKSIFIEKDF